MYDLISRHPFLSFAVAWVVVFVGTGVASYLTAPGSTLPQPPFGSGRAGQVAPDTGESAQEAVAGKDSGAEARERPRPGPAPAPPAGPPDGPDRSRAVLNPGSATESGAGPAGELAPAVKGTRTPPDKDTAGQSAASSDKEQSPDRATRTGPTRDEGRSTPGIGDSTVKPEEEGSGPAATQPRTSQSAEPPATTMSSEPPPSESSTAEPGGSSPSTSTASGSQPEGAPASAD